MPAKRGSAEREPPRTGPEAAARITLALETIARELAELRAELEARAATPIASDVLATVLRGLGRRR